MKIIGIDIGTTGICGVALGGDGTLLRSYTKPSSPFIDTGLDYERIQDVDTIMQVATEILESLVEEFKGDILAIGVTGQMHGILYYDKNGIAISPLYTWQDGRGNLPYGNTTYAKHLGSFSGYGNVTDFYNRENGLVPSGAVGYCTIHDYFAMRICGVNEPLMHVSDAASLGLFDVEKMTFDYDVNVNVTKDFAFVGEYRSIPVSCAIGDNQASVFASLKDEGGILVNVGTGSQVSCISDKPIVGEGIESRPYVGGKYLVVGAALCGGRAYSLLKDFYQRIFDLAGVMVPDVYALMNKMIESKDSTSLTVDTRFDGTRQNPLLRGGVFEIGTESFTPEDLTLATVKGIARELYNYYSVMGTPYTGLVGSGNGIRKNSALKKEVEELFGMKMVIPKYKEEAACGAALFAMKAAAAGRSDIPSPSSLIKYQED